MLGLLFLFILFSDFFDDEDYDKEDDKISDTETKNYLNDEQNKEKENNDHEVPSSGNNEEFYRLLENDEWIKFVENKYKLNELVNKLKKNFKINSSEELECFINKNFEELVNFYKNICDIETYKAEQLLFRISSVFGKKKISDFPIEKINNTKSFSR